MESFRSENENEGKYEFVCLVIVRIFSSPWDVKQARNSSPTARRQRNFEEKSLPRKRDFQSWVLYFQLIKNNFDVFFVKCVIPEFFPWKHVKMRRKERETGCLQARGRKKQYQTSRGQNSYSSSFSFSDVELPNAKLNVSFVIFLWWKFERYHLVWCQIFVFRWPTDTVSYVSFVIFSR